MIFDSLIHDFAAVAAVTTLIVLYLSWKKSNGNGYKLPPGPKGIPLLGNIFQLSSTPWKEFEAWKEEYGT
jgi:hypothetical protein